MSRVVKYAFLFPSVIPCYIKIDRFTHHLKYSAQILCVTDFDVSHNFMRFEILGKEILVNMDKICQTSGEELLGETIVMLHPVCV